VPVSQGTPVAAVKGVLVSWEELRPALAEAAGAVVLEEVVLDRTLAERVASLGAVIGKDAIEAERGALVRAMEADAAMSADEAAVQLDRLKRARGLGPARFDALLARNARLRAVARAEFAGEVTPTPEQLALEERIVNGDRYRVRVFLHPSQAVCAQVRDEVLAASGPSTPAMVSTRFAEAAVRQSTDASSRAGGLIDGVSALDPAVPEAVRGSLATLAPGEVSPVLVTGRGFGLVLMESRSPAPRTASREEVERRLRARLERLAMERLARELIAASGVTVLDPSLSWSWEIR
jgi:hypothetical protein